MFKMCKTKKLYLPLPFLASCCLSLSIKVHVVKTVYLAFNSLLTFSSFIKGETTEDLPLSCH